MSARRAKCDGIFASLNQSRTDLDNKHAARRSTRMLGQECVDVRAHMNTQQTLVMTQTARQSVCTMTTRLTIALTLLCARTAHSIQAARATAVVSRLGKEAPVLPVRVAESLSVEGGTQTVVCLCSDLPRTIAGAHEWMRRCTHEWEVVQCRGQWVARGKERRPTRTTKTAARVWSRRTQVGEVPVKRRVLFCSLQSASQLAAELEDASAPVDLLVVDTTGVHPKAQKPLQLARLAAHDSFFAVRHRLVMQAEGGPSLTPSQPASSDSDSRTGEAAEEELCIVTEVGTSCLGGDVGGGSDGDGGEDPSAAASAVAPNASAPRTAAPSPLPPDPIARRLASDTDGDDAEALSASTLAITGAATGTDGLLILSTAQMRAALARAAPATPLPESPEDLSQPHASAIAGAVDLALAVLYIFLVMAES